MKEKMRAREEVAGDCDSRSEEEGTVGEKL